MKEGCKKDAAVVSWSQSTITKSLAFEVGVLKREGILRPFFHCHDIPSLCRETSFIPHDLLS